jgi:hypothetical protein
MSGNTKNQGEHTPTVMVAEPADDTEALQRRRADFAHRAATKPFDTIVAALVSLIGVPLTAYLANVGEARAVREWMNGSRVPQPATVHKLQIALQIAEELHAEKEDGVIAAWFRGLNPALDDRPPAELIRNAQGPELSTIGRQILIAAREFSNS